MKKYFLIVFILASCSLMAINYPTYTGDGNTQKVVYTPVSGNNSGVSSLTPMLNEDGTAVTPYSTREEEQAVEIPGGPNRLQGMDEPAPVGGPVLPMLLFAMLAAGAVYLRRRKAAQA